MLVKYDDQVINMDKVLEFGPVDDEKREFPFQIRFISEGDAYLEMRFLYAETRKNMMKRILDAYLADEKLLDLDE